MEGRNMHVLIFTKQLCSYCDKAKALLKEHGLEYEEIDCTFSTECVEDMEKRSGRRTFPQIFLNGEHIGGYTELYAMAAAGHLKG